MAQSSLLKNSLFVGVGAVLMLILMQRPWSWTQAQSADPAAVVFAPEQGRTGVEPLSHTEQQQALKIVQDQLAAATSRQQTAKSVEYGQAGPPLMPLLVERHEETKATYQRAGWGRRADVYLYNYASNETIYALVDLGQVEVVQLERSRQLTLPIVPAEVTRIQKLLWNDPQVKLLLRDYYKLVQTQPLQKVEQLELHALVLHADQTTDVSAACTRHRCAQVIISIPDGDVFPFIVVVDLSDERVVTVLK